MILKPAARVTPENTKKYEYTRKYLYIAIRLQCLIQNKSYYKFYKIVSPCGHTENRRYIKPLHTANFQVLASTGLYKCVYYYKCERLRLVDIVSGK